MDTDSAVAPSPVAWPIIFYDDDCGFCTASIRRLIGHSPPEAFKVAPRAGKTFMQQFPQGDTFPESILYADHTGVYAEGTALIKILKRLNVPWSWLSWVLSICPLPCVNVIYRMVARVRKQLNPPVNQLCERPTPEALKRYLP